MRIACVYVPAFALQAVVQKAPHKRGKAFAVVVQAPAKPTHHPPNQAKAIYVCSQSAWRQGVRPGMRLSKARALAPLLEIVPQSPGALQQSLEALAETLLTLTHGVDISANNFSKLDLKHEQSPHISIYLRVPKHCKGESFGHKLLAALSAQGYQGRIGISDNRFSAWAAARDINRKNKGDLFASKIGVIPQGGAAAFLAPLPLHLLPLSPDIRQMLTNLGVTSIGDFAALPPPSPPSQGQRQRWSHGDTHFQQLAQGEGPTFIDAFAPQGPLSESIMLQGETQIEALAFCLRPLTERIGKRLKGRGMAMQQVALRLYSSDKKQFSETLVDFAEATLNKEQLFEALRVKMQTLHLRQSIYQMELVVLNETSPCRSDIPVFDLWDNPPSSHSVDRALKQMEFLLGTSPKEGMQTQKLKHFATRKSTPCKQGIKQEPHDVQIVLPLGEGMASG